MRNTFSDSEGGRVSTVERTSSQTTKAVVERFYAAIFAWDEEALRECLHENAELHQPPTLPYGGVYRGPAAMMELWKNVILPLADAGATTLETFVADGDVAVAVASTKTAATSKEITACEEYTVRDGRIARIRMFWFDPTPVAEAAAAAGVSAS